MSNVIEVTDSLARWVNRAERRLVVIDFFATWCGPCRMMHPIFDELSLKYKNVVFLRVDGDQHREISGEYGISGFPTFVFVYHGDEVDRVVGADPSGLEAKIQQYAQSAQTFTGTGNALGGQSVSAENARELRLKRFKDVKMQGSDAASGVSRMMKHLAKNVDEEEEVAEAESLPKEGVEDSSIRESLLTMGFSKENVDRTLRECKSRDIADLVTYISGLPETAPESNSDRPTADASHVEQPIANPGQPAQPTVVCDGNTCRLVPPKSLEERIAETKELMERRKREKAEKDKEEEKMRERERIEKGKEMLAKKEEFERQQRQREIEKEKRERLAEEAEKKRQLELWRKEHGLPEQPPEKKVEKTPEERARLLAESLALQRVDGVGATALRTLTVILTNTAKEDPKYRTLRKDNAVVKKKVLSVPGAVPLLQLAGFEATEDAYVMSVRDEGRVAMVLAAIAKCLSFLCCNHCVTHHIT
ncbi:hypothetical protein WA577_001552 [Blastocystis sp. JDR]